MKIGHIIIIAVLIYILYSLYNRTYGKKSEELKLQDEEFNSRVAALKQAWLENSENWCNSFPNTMNSGFKRSQCFSLRIEELEKIDFIAMQREIDGGSDALWQQYGANIWFPR